MLLQITRPTLVGSRCHNEGDVIEVEAAVGARLVKSGAAVDTDQVPEQPAGDDAEQPKPKRQRRGK